MAAIGVGWSPENFKMMSKSRVNFSYTISGTDPRTMGPPNFMVSFPYHLHMDVSENSGTTKIIHFNRVFHYKPSILGNPYFLETPISLGSLDWERLWNSLESTRGVKRVTVWRCVGPILLGGFVDGSIGWDEWVS